MRGDAESDPPLWIRPPDEVGKPVDEEVVAAAQRNWKRVRLYAQSHQEDESTAAEALELAVRSLALLAERHPNVRARIKSLDYYIYWASVHNLERLAFAQPNVEYLGSLDDLDELLGVQDSAWGSRIEKEILLKEIVGYMNEDTRFLFSLRQMGHSWEEIAGSLGSTAHNWESLFSKGIAKARRRVLGRTRVRSNPGPRPGRSE